MALWMQREEERLKLYKKYLEEKRLYCPSGSFGTADEKSGAEPKGNFLESEKYVLGPVLNVFVIWVLKEAVKSGKKRLYFLARDGYFMYRAALVYKEKWKLDMDCRYISCSRYCLRLPMFHLNERDALEYICRDSIGLDMEHLLNRAGLEQGEKEAVLKELGKEGKTAVSYAQLKEIKKALQSLDVFMEAMRKHSREALPALKGYLTQEGFLDGVSDAVVDSGWVGSMQKTLQEALRHIGRTEELEGYYFGLYELPKKVKRNTYHCFYFSPEGQLREKVNFNNNVFEVLFSAPHGMTLGYEKKEGKYVPVYGEIMPERKAYLESLETTLADYIGQAAKETESLENIDCEEAKKSLKKILKLFMTRPTRAEAKRYGNLSFCDDVLEYGNRPLAVKMNRRELRENHVVSKALALSGIRKKEIKESAWYEGSAVRCAKRPRYHLIQYSMYKYLLYMRQMYIWRKENGRNKKNES